MIKNHGKMYEKKNDMMGFLRGWVERSAGMGVGVGFAEALDGEMGVDLGGAKMGVAKKFLDTAKVGAGVEEVGGEGVAEFVRREGGGESDAAEPCFENALDGTRGEAGAGVVEEKRGIVGERPQLRGGLVGGMKGAERGFANHAKTFLVALAKHTRNACGKVGVASGEVDKFADAHAGGVEEFHDGGVAEGEVTLEFGRGFPILGRRVAGGTRGRAQQAVGLLHGWHGGECAPRTGAAEGCEGGGGNFFFGDEEFEEGF